MRLKENLNVTNSNLKGISSSHLDFIRGAAAIAVVLNHFRNIFFVKFEDIDNPNLLLKLLYSFTGLGHQAVIVFFVLSGFFISNSILSKVGENKWSWKQYLINRLTRLYVVLVPVLLMVFILDYTGSFLFDYSFFSRDMGEALELNVLLGNMFFLQEIFVPVLGSNDPLWSLSYEFWYYILFPCLFLVIANKRNAAKLSLYGGLSILILAILGINNFNLLQYFVVWLMGVLALVAPSLNLRNNMLKLLIKAGVFLSFITVLGLSRLGLTPSSFIGDLLLSITFAALVYTMVHLNTTVHLFQFIEAYYKRFSKKVADFSFTLYLVHFSILILLFASLNEIGIGKMQPTVINLFFGIFICSSVIYIAYLISKYTEKNTSKVRDAVNRLLSKKDKIDVLTPRQNTK